MSIDGLDEKRIYDETIKKIEHKKRLGLKAHHLHIPYVPNTKEYVKMYRWCELDKVIELKSEPFSTKEEALHFASCFNDSFLAEAICVEENGVFYVYSGWMIKSIMLVYALNNKNQFFTFANWS